MVQINTSSVIDAPVEAVWSTIRDFNALPSWHPVIADSKIDDGLDADKVGVIRHFHTKDGGLIRERLLTLSDIDHSCTYAILESPMDVANYVATLKLTRISDGDRTFCQWSATFDCPAGSESKWAEFIGQGVFQAGFDGLKKRFAKA